jgi:hypothetical protein
MKENALTRPQTTQKEWNNTTKRANGPTNTFVDVPGSQDLLGPPRSNLGLNAMRVGKMDQKQTPRLPNTTKKALVSFVPFFVPIGVLVDGVMVGN